MRWKIELAAVAVVLFVVVLFFAPRQNLLSITGFFSTETQRQQVNLEITESASYLLQNTAGNPLSLLQFSISGSVQGGGAAQVYLKDGSTQVLVYSNIHKKKQGLKGITGNFIDAPMPNGEQGEFLEILEKGSLQKTPIVPEGYEPAEESFKDSCSESCALPVEFYNDNGYTLDVLVVPGTSIKIDEIVFIAATEQPTIADENLIS